MEKMIRETSAPRGSAGFNASNIIGKSSRGSAGFNNARHLRLPSKIIN